MPTVLFFGSCIWVARGWYKEIGYGSIEGYLLVNLVAGNIISLHACPAAYAVLLHMMKALSASIGPGLWRSLLAWACGVLAFTITFAAFSVEEGALECFVLSRHEAYLALFLVSVVLVSLQNCMLFWPRTPWQQPSCRCFNQLQGYDALT